MRKSFVLIVVGLVILLTIVVAPGWVFAQTNASSAADRLRDQAQQRIDAIQDKTAQKIARLEEQVSLKLKNVVGIRLNHLEKVASREEVLLNRLQIRITAAKAAGRDVSKAEALMVDARAKLLDAQTKITLARQKTATLEDKAGFTALRTELMAIKNQLQTVRQDGAKIISIVKTFNSATSSGKNWQATGAAQVSTSSANR